LEKNIMEIDLGQLKNFFSQLRLAMKSPTEWLRGLIKSSLAALFTMDWASTDAAAKVQAKHDAAKGTGKAEAAGDKPAPVMSAYETVPPGKSFWDNPANDIRGWAEDVIRLQHNHDGAALGNLVDRLSSPDLTILLKEVETTRTRNQAAQEKFAKDVREGDFPTRPSGAGRFRPVGRDI
jgi:hypothetical protein